MRTDGELVIHILLAVFILIVLGGGLYSSISKRIQTDEEKRENASDISSCCDYVTFDGHEYVRYIEYNRGGIAHSPRCHCMTNGISQ